MTLDLAGFRELAPRERGQVLHDLVEALALADELWLRQHPDAPSIYDAGVRYITTNDNWRDVPAVVANHGADCMSLCAWRVAELRLRGVKCEPGILMQWDETGANKQVVFHVLVRYADGHYEDPSKRLGM
jgi:hypothetical protein